MKNRMAQNMSTFLMIIFGISMIFFLAGYKPIMWEKLEEQVGSDQSIGQSFINSLTSTFTNQQFLLLLGAAVAVSAGGLLLSGGSFSAAFLIPLFFFIAFANIFLIPTSFIFDSTLPEFMRIGFGVFLNLFLLIAILNFVKGNA